MRGLVLEGVGRVTLHGDLPDPTIEAPTDAVVEVRRAGLCGSDLHPYAGREPIRFGVVPGHEAVGNVVAVGAEVTDVAVGDRVIVPFTTSCGRCARCRRGLTARCVRGALFGFAPPDDPAAAALHGGQAELLRVPLADGTLVRAPAEVDDRCAVLLSDNLPTAWCAVMRAGLEPGATVAVVGLGAVGLCAVAVARWRGAGTVIGVDPVAARRERAARLGAVVATPRDLHARLSAVGGAHTEPAGGARVAAGGGVDAATGGSPDAEVGGSANVAAGGGVDAVAGGGPDVAAAAVIEAAGTPAAQALAFSLVRSGGTLSVIAVQTSDRFGFTPIQAYDANVTVRFGRASVRAALDRMLPALGDVGAVADVVVTDPDVPLADGPDTYERFARRTGGIVKATFAP